MKEIFQKYIDVVSDMFGQANFIKWDHVKSTSIIVQIVNLERLDSCVFLFF